MSNMLGRGDEVNRKVNFFEKEPRLEMEKGDWLDQNKPSTRDTCDDLIYQRAFTRAPLGCFTNYSGEYVPELVGRVYCPNGVLPSSLFHRGQPQLNKKINNFWIKEIYFVLAQLKRHGQLADYNITFYVYKPDYFPDLCPQRKQIEPDLSRQPPIRSHAYGIMSRYQMDTIDGIKVQKVLEKLPMFYSKDWTDLTNVPPKEERLPSIRSHARGIISRDAMDRLDGLNMNREEEQTQIQAKLMPSAHTFDKIMPVMLLTAIEVDCFDVLMQTILKEAMDEDRACSQQVFHQNIQESASLAAQVTDINEGVPKKTKKTSIRKQIVKALRRLLCVVGKSGD